MYKTSVNPIRLLSGKTTPIPDFLYYDDHTEILTIVKYGACSKGKFRVMFGFTGIQCSGFAEWGAVKEKLNNKSAQTKMAVCDCFCMWGKRSYFYIAFPGKILELLKLPHGKMQG